MPAEAAPAIGESAMPALPSGSSDIAGTPPAVPSETAPAAPAAEPAKPAEAAPTTPAETSHTVAAGDTYWDLAKKAYGDATKWKLISEANKDYKPRRLPLGATLTIPPAAK
jgi:5'-nucleotidase